MHSSFPSHFFNKWWRKKAQGCLENLQISKVILTEPKSSKKKKKKTCSKWFFRHDLSTQTEIRKNRWQIATSKIDSRTRVINCTEYHFTLTSKTTFYSPIAFAIVAELIQTLAISPNYFLKCHSLNYLSIKGVSQKVSGRPTWNSCYW